MQSSSRAAAARAFSERPPEFWLTRYAGVQAVSIGGALSAFVFLGRGFFPGVGGGKLARGIFNGKKAFVPVQFRIWAVCNVETVFKPVDVDIQHFF